MSPSSPAPQESARDVRRWILPTLLVPLFILTTGNSCPPAGGQAVEVKLLGDQVVLPNGDVSDLNVVKVGTTKRVRVKITPHGNTVPDAEVHLQFSLNQNSSLAMNNPTSVVARRLNGSPTTVSTFFVDVPGSKDLDRCQWFHFRWFIRYIPSGSSALTGVYAGQVQTFQVTATQAPGSDITEPPCPGVP